MLALNLFKVGVILLADAYTKFKDPFDEFTRKGMFKPTVETFSTKEEKFFRNLVDNFALKIDSNTIIWMYKKEENAEVDMGDQSLWQGVTTFMLCLRYRSNPTLEMESLIRKSANGMMHQQRRYAEEKPRLVRGVLTADGSVYKDDVSNDQLTGHILGIYGLLKYTNGDLRAMGVSLARGIADSLISNDFKLVNVDGTPTKFGKLENGYLTDGLNISICLATLKLASSTFNGLLPDYEEPYQALFKKYKDLIPYGYVTLDKVMHDYDAHRAMIVYSILSDLEKDHDMSRVYVKGLMRGWKHDRKARNPWSYYLMRRIMLMDPRDWEGCLVRLAEIEVDEKYVVQERKNSVNKEYWEKQGIRFFKWRKDRLYSSQPLPLWMVGSQDFFWQRSQYSVDQWEGMTKGSLMHNGVDFLVCYWGFKELKLI